MWKFNGSLSLQISAPISGQGTLVITDAIFIQALLEQMIHENQLSAIIDVSNIAKYISKLGNTTISGNYINLRLQNYELCFFTINSVVYCSLINEQCGGINIFNFGTCKYSLDHMPLTRHHKLSDLVDSLKTYIICEHDLDRTTVNFSEDNISICKYGVRYCKNISTCSYKIHIDVVKIGKINGKLICLFNILGECKRVDCQFDHSMSKEELLKRYRETLSA